RRPCSMSLRCDRETPRRSAKTATLSPSDSPSAERAPPRERGPPINCSRNFFPESFAFLGCLVVMFVHLFHVDRFNGSILSDSVNRPVRLAQPDRADSFPFPEQGMVPVSPNRPCRFQPFV